MKSVMFCSVSLAAPAAFVNFALLGQSDTAQADGAFICQTSLLGNDLSWWRN